VRYPLLSVTGPAYGKMFESWLETRGRPDALEARLRIAGEMRDLRKQIVTAYWPQH